MLRKEQSKRGKRPEKTGHGANRGVHRSSVVWIRTQAMKLGYIILYELQNERQ